MIKALSRKLLLSFLLCTIALLFLNVDVSAAKIRLRVQVTKANIRMEPDTNSAIITSVPRGAVLEADEKQGNWYRVYLPPNATGVVVSGYIHINLVEPMEVSPQQPQSEKVRIKAPRKAARIPSSPPKTAQAGRTSGLIRGYGVKFGLNLATWYGKDVREGGGDLKNKTGFITGGFVTINVYKKLGFQPEILFTQKGTKAEGLGITMTMVTDYIEIPLLLKASPGVLVAGISPIFYIGPAIGINIRKQAVVKMGGDKDKSDIEDLKVMDIGLVYGTGIHYQPNAQGFLGQIKLILDIRYTLGLVTISDLPDTKIMNGVFSILFGLCF